MVTNSVKLMAILACAVSTQSMNAMAEQAHFPSDLAQQSPYEPPAWHVVDGAAAVSSVGGDSVEVQMLASAGVGLVSRPLPTFSDAGTTTYSFRVKGIAEAGNLVNLNGALISFYIENTQVSAHVFQPDCTYGKWIDTGYRGPIGWTNIEVVDDGNSWKLLINKDLYAEGVGHFKEAFLANGPEVLVYGNEERDFFLDAFTIDHAPSIRESGLYFTRGN